MSMTAQDIFSRITTIGDTLCFPFSYKEKRMDFIDFVQEKIKEYLEIVKQLDVQNINDLNNGIADYLALQGVYLKFDFLRDLFTIPKNQNQASLDGG